MSAGPVLRSDPHFRRRLVSPEASGRCGVCGSGMKGSGVSGAGGVSGVRNGPHRPEEVAAGAGRTKWAQVAERLMAADCKSAAPCELRRFESSPVHQKCRE